MNQTTKLDQEPVGLKKSIVDNDPDPRDLESFFLTPLRETQQGFKAIAWDYLKLEDFPSLGNWS